MDTLPTYSTATRCGMADELPHQLKLLCLAPHRPESAPLMLQLEGADRGAPILQWCATATEAITRLRNESFHCIVIADSRSAERASDSLFGELLSGIARSKAPTSEPAPQPLDMRPLPPDGRDGLVASDAPGSGDRVAEPPATKAYDAFDVIGAIRSAGCRDPIVLLAPRLAERDWERVADSDAEVLVSPMMWSSAALGPTIRRALSRHRLRAEVDRLETLQRQRVDRERREAEQVLAHQAALLTGARDATGEGGALLDGRPPQWREAEAVTGMDAESAERWVRSAVAALSLPEPLRRYYRELLRSYVIMGSGNMAEEIGQLAGLLQAADITPTQAFALHVATVFELIRGLGRRSTRHVMTRADLLIIELLLRMSRSVSATHQHSGPDGQADDGKPPADDRRVRPAA